MATIVLSLLYLSLGYNLRFTYKALHKYKLINDTIIKKYDLKTEAVHDHYPENDAEHILDLLLMVMKKNNSVLFA